MDFRRIEIIFLIVFIGLDIFLFTSYSQSAHSVVMTNNSGHSTISKEMSDDNIIVGKLSKKSRQGYYLATRDNDYLKKNLSKLKNQEATFNLSKHLLSSTLNNPIDIKSSDAEYKLNKFIHKKTNVLYGKDYVYSSHLSSSGQIIYAQRGSVGTVYDESAQLIFHVENHQVVSYQQSYINTVNVLREKQSTISEQKAILSLYTNNEIPSNSQIKWTYLAYTKLLKVKGSTIYVPVWFVGFKTKTNSNLEIRQVNAFNGAVIKDQNERS